jgi:hypothetical protein
MRKLDFSEIVAIVTKGERAHTRFQWELGDALIQTIGRPSSGGENDGSYAKLEACSEELSQHGYEYEAHTLRTFRFIATKFPAARRRAGLSFETHREAADPDMLDTIIAGAPRNQKITRDYVREVMRGLALARQRELDADTERRRQVADKARQEREAAEADQHRAKTAAERKAAAEKAAAAAKREKAANAPPRARDVPHTKPKPEDVPIFVATAAFLRDLSTIKRGLTKLRETYAPLLKVFPREDIENGHEELMIIAERARAFADELRPNGGKASHLSVVGQD